MSADNSSVVRGTIVKIFPETFELILSTEYNEGTYYGNFRNFDEKSGQSTIYVPQPDLEDELRDIVERESDSFKWLIGFKGIGKTTLLKNHFRIFERGAEIRSNQLVIYISFMGALKAAGDVESFIAGYIQDASNALIESEPKVKELSVHPDFWNDFYAYIKINNSPRLSAFDDLPGHKTDTKEEKLHLFEEKEPEVYRVWLLKYYLEKSAQITRVVLIFDDLETFGYDVQTEIIQSAMNLNECFKTNKTRNYKMKTFVSLRTITIRENLRLLNDAFRNNLQRDCILKKSIPDIQNILNQRVEEGKTNLEPIRFAEWEGAATVLRQITRRLSSQEGIFITKLTNYGIFRALSAFGTIIGNKRYFHRGKEYKEGMFGKEGFKIEDFDFGQDAIYKALFLQERDAYRSQRGDLLCNILASYSAQRDNCELLGLYIIQYLLRSLSNEELDLYGVEDDCETGEHIVKSICSAIAKKGTDDYQDLEGCLDWMMKHLYKGSVLLRSIYDDEDPEEAGNAAEKEYCDSGRLYLSLRGKALFDMLLDNSLLLEILIDDIKRPNPKSFEMDFSDRTLYLLDYIKGLFQSHETAFIRSANQIDGLVRYIKQFGNVFLTSKLLVGIRRSISRYFNMPAVEEAKKEEVKRSFNAVLKIMEDYSNRMNDDSRIYPDSSLREYRFQV